MNVEEVRDHALAKANVDESFPFDETTLVLKVNGKMFLLVSLDSDPLQINVKCDPDKAIRLREEYTCIIPGYQKAERALKPQNEL
jgi:predicted DNA-binding protein (MmcQ/YjbR family)